VRGSGRRRPAVGLAALASCSVVLTSCGAGGDAVPGEVAAEVGAPTGSQQVWCAGDGPAVVLVNGIGDDATSEQWTEVQRALTGSARVCRYDRPGTGANHAPRAAARGADELDAELDAVVDHAAGRGPVVLVAHSFGGYLARVHADRHPDRVDGLVFVDALDPSVGLLGGTGAPSLEEVAMADERLDLRDIEQAARSVTALEDDPHLVVLVRGEGAGRPWTAGQERLAALSGRSETVVVPGAGHQIPSEAPEAVAAAVEDVLRLAG
jgi:pimeloyl-ACP methyl ester carboxylesterase